MEDVPIGEIYGCCSTAPVPRSTIPLRNRRQRVVIGDYANEDLAANINGRRLLPPPLRSLTPGAALVSTTPAVIVATLLSPCAARLAEPNALTGSVFVDEFYSGQLKRLP
jgi:hypothetical protein